MNKLEAPPLAVDILTRWGQGQTGALTGSTRPIVENDLVGALDHWKGEQLYAIVQWCHDHLPDACWGSAAKVAAWREAHQ